MLPMHEPHPFTYARKPKALLLAHFGGIEPDAVILDGQMEAGFAFAQGNGHVAGAGMLGDVVEPFLDDSVQRQ